MKEIQRREKREVLLGQASTVGGVSRELGVTEQGMRHVVLGLIIALNTFPDPAVHTRLVAFTALMVPPNMLLTVYIVIRFRKAARGSKK